MTKEQLAPWLEKLNQAEKKDRNGIVAEMCREHGLKIGDAWNLLKEAGFNPKAATEDKPKAEEKKVLVTLWHTTTYPLYHRAGLLLSLKPKTYEVNEAQLAVLKKDQWVEIIET
jgi:hypothetical protein